MARAHTTKLTQQSETAIWIDGERADGVAELVALQQERIVGSGKNDVGIVSGALKWSTGDGRERAASVPGPCVRQGWSAGSFAAIKTVVAATIEVQPSHQTSACLGKRRAKYRRENACGCIDGER